MGSKVQRKSSKLGFFLGILLVLDAYGAQSSFERARHGLSAAIGLVQSRQLSALQTPTFFKGGEKWKMAVTRAQAMHAHGEAKADQSLFTKPRIYLYEVLQVSPKGAEIEIRPETVTSRYSALRIVIDRNYQIQSKRYQFSDGTPDLKIQEAGAVSAGVGLEPIPIALPQMKASSKPMETQPQPPETFKKAGYAIDFTGDVRELESEDLLGRKVSAFWREGEAWPFYVQSNSEAMTRVK